MTSSTMLTVYRAYDREVMANLPLSSWTEVDDCLAAAYQSLLKGHSPALADRLESLFQLALLVEKQAERFATLIAEAGGKPIRDARLEVKRAITGLRFVAGAAPQWLIGREHVSAVSAGFEQKRIYSRIVPKGVVLAISAFNHPLNLLVHQVAPAIAAGCPVLIKPALQTPQTALLFTELCVEAGIVSPMLKCIVCDNEVSETLAADARLAVVSFIGSAKVGWTLRSKLAAGVECLLEHGGNAPVILLPYADQDQAIAAIIRGGMMHAGQVCISTQRVYVPWIEAATFSRKLAEAADALQVGNPLNDSTDVGPLIHPAELLRVHAWVQEAIAAGAKLLCGGQPASETCYQPTILLDAPANVKLSSEEAFAPVICVYGYDDVADAISRANDSRYAFHASIFGRELASVEAVIPQLQASCVIVNDHTALRADPMPFGGYKQSGLGQGGFEATVKAYSRETLVIR